MRYIKIILLLTISTSLFGQEYPIDPNEIYRSPARKVLNMFSFTVTTGYNSTTYSHNLNGFWLLQTDTAQYIVDNTGEDLGLAYDIYGDWFNDPFLAQSVSEVDSFDVPFVPILNPVNNPLLLNNGVLYNSDSLGLGFKGKGWSVPLNLSMRFNYEKFRVGFGISLEYHKVKSLKPTVDGLGIRSYQPNFSNAFFFSYYGQLGYRFYDYWDYSFAAELNVGKNKMGGNWNSGLKEQGMFINFGISIEKNLSEYARIIFKPSYDFKSYTMNIPGLDKSIKHSNPTLNFHVGVSITIPEIPRSPIKSDHVQLKHVITDPETGRIMEVRGQPIWKKQNPKVGENHRKLIKYKGKNKKKINPY